MTDPLRILALGLVLGSTLVACGKQEARPTPRRDDWVIRSQIEARRGKFFSEDYRLIVPYIVGELSGPVDSSSYITVPVNPDGSFELDLNQGHAAMLADLEKLKGNEFRDISVEPRDALVATARPEIVDRRFNRLGSTQWVDGRTGEVLKLAYFDRPTHLVGKELDVEVPSAGYFWIGRPAPSGTIQLIPQPDQLRLRFYYEERS